MNRVPGWCVTAVIVLSGCGGDGNENQPDFLAPAAIRDLDTTGVVSDTFLELTWTAPGDDERSGTAAAYHLRFSTDPLNDDTWDAVAALVLPIPPAAAGETETHFVTGLSPATQYRLAVRTVDDALNISGLSNVVTVTTAEDPMQLTREWGGYGVGPGEFQFPRGVTVGNEDRIYVADERNDRIQRFNASGRFQLAVGDRGSAVGQFIGPHDVAADAFGNIYVTDRFNHRVQMLDENGGFILAWGGEGSGSGQFVQPWGIGVGPGGTVYVADTGNERIQAFTANGQFLAAFTLPGSPAWEPTGLHADADGNVYVADRANDRVVKFNSAGGFQTEWGESGPLPGEFDEPFDVAVDGVGRVYVVDHRNHRIQVFTPAGEYLYKIGKQGENPGEFQFPHGLALDSGDVLHVVEIGGTNRAQTFAYPPGPASAP